MEIIVRDGKYFTIGDNGAEFFTYRKGDVIFSAEQSEQILEKGKITHGKRRGKALVDGTAFAEGTAFRLGSGSSGGGTTSSSKKKKSGSGSKKGSGKKGGSKKSSSKDDKTTIDWIEIDLKRAEREVKNLKTVADNAFKTFETRTKNLRKEIGATNNEIWLQQQAYEGYIKAANKVSLDEDLKRKVRNGSIEISKYGSDTQKKIKEYQDLYEKALKSKDSIEELRQSVSKLYKQNFENAVKKWDNALKSLQNTAEKINDAIDLRTKKASDYVKAINQTNALKNNIVDYGKLIKNANSQLAKRRQEVQNLNKLLNEAIKKGAVKYGSEEYYSMLENIRSAEKEIRELNSQIVDYTNDIAESYQKLFEQVDQKAENTLSIYSHFTNTYNKQIELAEAKGLATSRKHYEALLKIEKANLEQSKKLAKDLQNSLNNAIASGSIKRGSQAWYEMTERINEAKEATDEAAIAIQNYANQIRKIEWDRFDTLQDKISEVIDESKFLIDLMADGEMFDDKGQLSNIGLSTAGLHVMNYDVYSNQAKQYADEMAKVNELLAKDPNNLTLIERRKELLELQRDAILAAQKEKQEIKSLVEDGIKEEISYMDDLIDKYIDALDSQKDLYDYQNKVKDQTGKIASLQKQLTAYSGDTSEEARQKIQKIKVSLEDAKNDLRDTEYNKYITDSKKLLNELKSDFKDSLNERLDDVNALMRDIMQNVDDNSGVIMQTLEEQSESVGYTISGNIKDVWSSENNVLSSTNSMISDIYNVLLKIWEYADSLAKQDVTNVSVDNEAKQNSERAAEQKSVKTSNTSSNKNTATKKKTIPSNYTGLYGDNGNTYYYVNGKKQTGWKNMNAGKRYFSVKDGKMLTGEQKIGNNVYYFDKKTGVMKTGAFTIDDTTYETDKNGVLIFKGKNAVKNKTGITGIGISGIAKKYASGSSRISRDQIGWTNERGQELLYRKNSGAIMTPLSSGDKVFSNEMANNLWNMSQSGGLESLVKNIIHGNGLADGYDALRSGLASLGQTNVQQNFDNITFSLPNVTDYKSFIKQMQTDKNFEKFIQSMTIGRINGKPKDMKRHISF